MYDRNSCFSRSFSLVLLSFGFLPRYRNNRNKPRQTETNRNNRNIVKQIFEIPAFFTQQNLFSIFRLLRFVSVVSAEASVCFGSVFGGVSVFRLMLTIVMMSGKSLLACPSVQSQIMKSCKTFKTSVRPQREESNKKVTITTEQPKSKSF